MARTLLSIQPCFARKRRTNASINVANKAARARGETNVCRDTRVAALISRRLHICPVARLKAVPDLGNQSTLLRSSLRPPKPVIDRFTETGQLRRLNLAEGPDSLGDTHSSRLPD